MSERHRVDPFARYMNEKKRTIDAINEIPEVEEIDEMRESAVITQDSIRTQVSSVMNFFLHERKRTEVKCYPNNRE